MSFIPTAKLVKIKINKNGNSLFKNLLALDFLLPNSFGQMNFIKSKDDCSCHKYNKTSPPNSIFNRTFPGVMNKIQHKI